MELLNLAIEVTELDAYTVCYKHYQMLERQHAEDSDSPFPLEEERYEALRAATDRTFYRCRIELNGKKMQMESPLAEPHHRQEMLMAFIEKAWAEISAQAFPPSKMPLIIAG